MDSLIMFIVAALGAAIVLYYRNKNRIVKPILDSNILTEDKQNIITENKENLILENKEG